MTGWVKYRGVFLVASFKGYLLSAIFALCLSVADAQADGPRGETRFVLIDEKIISDIDNRSTIFEMKFSQVPDFLSVDEFGRQSNSFQYYISNMVGRSPVPEVPGAGLDIVIRGGEIARTGRIVVRLAEGGEGEQGWGAVVAQVPFVQHGEEVAFTIPWTMLRETDGQFSYSLLLLEYGAASDHRSGIGPTER